MESAVANDVVSAMKARRVRRVAVCVRLNVQVKSVAPMMDVVDVVSLAQGFRTARVALWSYE